VHSRLPARLTLLVAVVAVAACLAAVVLTAGPASATPDKQADCSLCHGTGAYTGTVTATPSARYPAASAAYTVGITISQNLAGQAGYWIANSTAAGGTGATTGVFAGPADQNAWTASRTAPATEGVYYYKVFGEDGPKGNSGQVNFAVYSITVDKTAPVTTDNHDGAKHSAFKLVLSPTDAVSGVALTQYSIDSGVWTSGTTVTLSLPRRHRSTGLSAGTHTVQYRSTDNAGNLETIKSCQVILGR
jgi:cytochrome c